MNELEKQVVEKILYEELEPYRPTHAKDWARDLAEQIHKTYKSLGLLKESTEWKDKPDKG